MTHLVEIENVIRAHGLELDTAADLDRAVAGQIERLEKPDTFKISVASHLDDIKWKRYTMAHELGHYMLHESLIGKGVDDNTAFFSTSDGNFDNPNFGMQQEYEAHVFAARTLMPPRKLKDKLSSLVPDDDENIETLENYFGVPASVIMWWIDVLNKGDWPDET